MAVAETITSQSPTSSASSSVRWEEGVSEFDFVGDMPFIIRHARAANKWGWKCLEVSVVAPRRGSAFHPSCAIEGARPVTATEPAPQI